MQRLLQATLPLRHFQQQNQVSRSNEPRLDPRLRRQIAQADRQMRLSHPRRAQQDDVLGSLVARQSGESSRIASPRNAPEPRLGCLTRMLP